MPSTGRGRGKWKLGQFERHRRREEALKGERDGVSEGGRGDRGREAWKEEGRAHVDGVVPHEADGDEACLRTRLFPRTPFDPIVPLSSSRA
eukprot:275606-Rhodomonas_salina.1